jgi:hypothetical protein
MHLLTSTPIWASRYFCFNMHVGAILWVFLALYAMLAIITRKGDSQLIVAYIQLVYSCTPYSYSKSKRIQGCIVDLIIPTNLVCVLLALPSLLHPSIFYSIYCFLYLLLFLFHCPMGKAGNSYLSATPSCMVFQFNSQLHCEWLKLQCLCFL